MCVSVREVGFLDFVHHSTCHRLIEIKNLSNACVEVFSAAGRERDLKQ